MRLYCALGLSYRKGDLPPLIKRLRERDLTNHSWVDLFFTHSIYILGLALDFVEFHLWWLLTFRARATPRSKLPVGNRIVYLCRDESTWNAERFEAKVSMLRASLVEVQILGTPEMSWEEFYEAAVEWLRGRVGG